MRKRCTNVTNAKPAQGISEISDGLGPQGPLKAIIRRHDEAQNQTSIPHSQA